MLHHGLILQSTTINSTLISDILSYLLNPPQHALSAPIRLRFHPIRTLRRTVLFPLAPLWPPLCLTFPFFSKPIEMHSCDPHYKTDSRIPSFPFKLCNTPSHVCSPHLSISSLFITTSVQNHLPCNFQVLSRVRN